MRARKSFNNNEGVNADTDSLIYFILGSGKAGDPDPVRLVGYETTIGVGNGQLGNPYTDRQWGYNEGDTREFAWGRVFPKDRQKYPNANSLAYIHLN